MVRLINANDMIKSLMDMTFYDEEGHTIHDYEDRLAIVKSFVDSVPTVDAEPVIRCKDCRKQNKRVGFDENFKPVYKEDACPLISWRGKAKGHEFDYQFCCCAERKKE